MTDHVEVRRGAYADSVSLMQVSMAVRSTEGVVAALVAMATDLNVSLLRDLAFEVPEAAPNDLLVAVRAQDEDGVAAGIATVEAELKRLKEVASSGSNGFGAGEPPRTVSAACTRTPDATLALVSVPGEAAFAEALDAIEAGVNVMVFSDNVPLEQEIALKDAAARHGVLVMGPDCGTAVVGGVAFGFANRVRSGPIGVVAASGTGAQQVLCLLDAAGSGVSHCLGVGGRDLSAAVGARSARAALRALDADPTTERILLVSKPADRQVTRELEELASSLTTPVHWATLGPGRPDLTAAVEQMLREAHVVTPVWPHTQGPTSEATANGHLRGLFCGGTLADEAMIVAGETFGGIRSNIPLAPELALAGDAPSVGHVVIDFGDDDMTRGRPHPMIDPSLRLTRILEEATDPACGVLLLDLVLGHGAHPEPTGDLAAAIRDGRARAANDGRDLPVVVSLVGTQDDPQGLQSCRAALADAGASVYLSNAEATRHAIALLTDAKEN